MSENKLKAILPIVILIVGAVGAVTMVKLRAPVETKPPSEYATVVRVVEVVPGPYDLAVKANGTVGPRTEVSLVPEVAGRVVSVGESFEAGGFFRAGEALLTIDPRDYELAVVTARSEVARARVRLETEQARAKLAREEWRELGDGSPSPLATRELQLEEARATLAAAKAALEKAELNLERTRVRAPFDGRVREKLADVGQYVTPGVTVGFAYAVDYAEIPLPVPDRELAYLDLTVTGESFDGPVVTLNGDFAGTRASWTGRIVRVEGELSRTTRMINLVARVEDPYGRKTDSGGPPLAYGMFVEGVIAGRTVPNAVVLPRAALRGDDVVLVVDETERLRFREVSVLRAEGDDVIVDGGLEPGERVCVSTLDTPTDGMKVRAQVVGDPGDENPPIVREDA